MKSCLGKQIPPLVQMWISDVPEGVGMVPASHSTQEELARVATSLQGDGGRLGDPGG